uniref:Uncharacterized protein n=1 Tax=Rhizophora mucronata TaxID=61149 RepID=A0A2P2P4V1_RHIMU
MCCRVMLKEMWTRSCSLAPEEPGKPRSVLIQRVGYRVLLHVLEIAWVGFLRAAGSG